MENGIKADDVLAKLAEIYIGRGQLSHATDFMERVAKIDPANLGNMENLATTYLVMGRTGDTERVVRAILVQNPRDATAHNVYGNLEIQRGREAEARQHFEQAIKCDPSLAEPYLNLGLIAQNAGEMSTAIACYQNFLRKADKDKHREHIPKVKAALAGLHAN